MHLFTCISDIVCDEVLRFLSDIEDVLPFLLVSSHIRNGWVRRVASWYLSTPIRWISFDEEHREQSENRVMRILKIAHQQGDLLKMDSFALERVARLQVHLQMLAKRSGNHTVAMSDMMEMLIVVLPPGFRKYIRREVQESIFSGDARLMAHALSTNIAPYVPYLQKLWRRDLEEEVCLGWLMEKLDWCRKMPVEYWRFMIQQL